MFETQSRWEDTGYDCDHCGGELLMRSDEEPDRLVQRYYQCRRCGCQWSPGRERIRVGTLRACKARVGGVTAEVPRWVWVVVALVVVLLVLRAGAIGLFLARYLIPVLFVVVSGYAIYRVGRQQAWW